MSNAETSSGNAVIATIAVLLLILLGAGSLVSYSKEQSLEAQLAALPYVPVYDSYGMPTQWTEDQRASVSERRRLQGELADAQQATQTWTNFLGGYVIIAVITGALIATAMLVRDATKGIAHRVAERRASNPEPILSKIAGAADAVSKVLPRQPTMGGGRLSTADELRKWAALKEEGLITEEEFVRMREKLLG